MTDIPPARIPTVDTYEFRIAYQGLESLLETIPAAAPERRIIKLMLSQMAALKCGAPIDVFQV